MSTCESTGARPASTRSWASEHPCSSPSGAGARIEVLLARPDLKRWVIEAPDDDAPRVAFLDHVESVDHDLARAHAAFVGAQLTVARAFRANRRANVSPLRRWRRDGQTVSIERFRHGEALRPWLLDGLEPLTSLGLVAWPQVYRGFVERVGVRAARLPTIARNLFSSAPIRHLVLVGVPPAIDELAQCPYLVRIRSLSLPVLGAEDVLTDDALARLLRSPYLHELRHLRLVRQRQLTPRALEMIATSSNLPMLSAVEIFRAGSHVPRRADDRDSDLERMLRADSPKPTVRDAESVHAAERACGYAPHLHPEQHYGEQPDLEAIVENPIARQASIMSARGTPVVAAPPASHRRL